MYERNLWVLMVIIGSALLLTLFAAETLLSPLAVGWAGPVQQGIQYEEETIPGENDTIGTAEDFYVPGIMRGTLVMTDDIDCYGMSFDSSNNTYELTLYDTDSTVLDLELYDYNETFIADLHTDASQSASLTWEADESFFYVCVSPSAVPLSSDADYRLTVVETTIPTETPTPTNTPTPYPTPEGLVEEEPNDAIEDAIFLPLNQIMYGAIAGIYDQDFYYIESDPGQRYRIILNDWEYDRRVEVYDEDGNYMDSTTTASSSRAELTFTATDARHYLGIFKSSTASPEGTTVDYDVRVYQLQPTPTPTSEPTNTPGPGTPTPAPTWVSGYDEYEPNFNFDTAASIAPGVTYSLNFTPWGGSRIDNDYFRLWVKPGLMFTCETFDLGPVVDTNMILYDANGNVITGNDDRTLGDYSSKISYYASYEGFVYLLVGTGERLSFEDAKDSPYKLKCEKSVPGQTPGDDDEDDGPSKAPTPQPTNTPRPTATSSSPVATPTPGEGEGGSVALSFRPLKTPPPLTPTPTPSGFRNFRVIIYYDDNADGTFGAGEGVTGFYVRVVEGATGEELARGYTDEQGQLSFSVPTVGTVRVVVPLLGVDRLVDPTMPELKIRVAPLPLPDVIP